ncbi:TolC family protein [Soonwooa sp.]|uniref:TolC family protein n=1 Tax=Soonwooa sp. TaxID=1938592 RepID=UPI00260B742B|nr:TolC family protein [Soonwooa sp.]
MKLRNILAASVICFSISGYGQKIWTLQECVDYAVKSNLQVIQNNYNKKMQESNLTIAKKGHLPTVSGNISNTASFGQSQDVFGFSQRNDNFNNSANLGANVLVYNNGRVEKNIRKVQFDVEASQFDIATIQNNISLQIAQQYLSILLNREIVKISQSAVNNANKLYERAKITTEVGTTAQTVLAEAQAAVAREKQNLKVAEVNRDRSRFALAQLLMLQDYKDFDIEDAPVIFDPQAPDLLVDQVLNKAYNNQPEIKAAESRIKSSEAQTEVAKTAYWPTVTATAGIGSFYFNSLATNTIGVNPDGTPIKERPFFRQYKDNFGQQVGLSANIPIFNQGVTKLQVEQTKINQEIAKNNLELQKQDVKQNVQKAAFDADANYQTYVTSVEAEKSTKLALDFAEKSYEAGRTSIYDLNIARNNYANAQGSVAQAKYNYLFSQKLLDFYSGIPLSL